MTPMKSTKSQTVSEAEQDEDGEEEHTEDDVALDDSANDASFLGLRQSTCFTNIAKSRLCEIAAKMKSLDDE